ncbi:hypothetical protein TD95_000489 [Thielaviopsis punctulata]|uniref:mitogen-activated protein kinase n=1 Tax=Thielaviopsis punctulata TaxID=72032 RepID=A0A0F4ZAQ5_9PEZI|nr:hypothetical protein TD95_000489 [Thielaviopsis punctulata]
MAPQDGQRQVRFKDQENSHSPDGRASLSGRAEYSPDPRQTDKARPSYLNPHNNNGSYTRDSPQNSDRDRDRNRDYPKSNGNNHVNPYPPTHGHGYQSRHKARQNSGNGEDEDENIDDNGSSLIPNAVNTNSRFQRTPISGDEHSQPRAARPSFGRTSSHNLYNPSRGRPSAPQSNRPYSEFHSGTRRPERNRRKHVLSNLRRRNMGYDFRINDSDSEGEAPAPEEASLDSETVMFLISENQEPTEADYQDPNSAERLNWQSMLTSVLSGDVIGQEKQRLTPTIDKKDPKLIDEFFIAFRAAYFRRHESVQRKTLEDARSEIARHIDAIMNFKVKGEDEADGKDLMAQVNDVLGSIQKCHSMYPSIQRLEEHHHAAKTEPFKKSSKTIIAWHNTVKMIELQLNILRLWVGNDDLVIEKSEDGVAKEASSFIHRLLNDGSLPTLYSATALSDTTPSKDTSSNDNSENAQSKSESAELSSPKALSYEDEDEDEDEESVLQRARNGGVIIDLLHVIRRSKKTIIKYANEFNERHLPPPIEELTTLINFPSRLVQTMLQEQVANAKTTNIKMAARTNSLILDQMMLQFKTLLRISVGIDTQYQWIIKHEHNWDVPDSVDETYVQDVFMVLRFYFKMLNWKLANNKNTFKEAEVLFQEWEFVHSIGGHFDNWEVELAEHFTHVTHKTLARLADTFEREMREKPEETIEAMNKRIKACLDSVRVRQRMLQRFSRLFNDNYANASDYSLLLEPSRLQEMFRILDSSDHVRLQSHFDEQGIMIICSPSIIKLNKMEYVKSMMALTSEKQIENDSNIYYVILIMAEDPPIWPGKTVAVQLGEQVLDLQPGYLRLLATSTDERHSQANEAFLQAIGMKLDLVMDRRSNITKVNQKLTELRRVAFKISNIAMESAEIIRAETRGKGCEELVHTCFMAATEFGQRAVHYMDENRRQLNNIKLSKLGLDWVSFIDEDCTGTDKRTLRWAMQALEFVSGMTRGRQILGLSDSDWTRLRQSVSGCMKILVQHLDVMGARSSVQAKAEQDRKYEAYEKQTKMLEGRLKDDEKAAELVSESRLMAINKYGETWPINDSEKLGVGRVLEDDNELDRSLMDITSATNNGSMRWQLGNLLGSGAFGRVYVGVNLSRGQMMAVKEIRLQKDIKAMAKVKSQIIHEVNILKSLDHPNIVACYGVEVRRDRVYIFMEFCSGGSLAGLVDGGPIDDEVALQEVTLSILEGLKYLHERNIVHRDIKPANILLDHNGIVKIVDFGAAKVLDAPPEADNVHAFKSLMSHGSFYNVQDKKASAETIEGTAGTPMYMAPETIEKTDDETPKAADIWSLGCVVLELATGQPPWPGADNEFAVMFKIGNGVMPEMPSENQLSLSGCDFILRCLVVDPKKRATVDDLMKHPWIQQAVAASKDSEVEMPSDSSQGGTPSGTRGPTDGYVSGC